MGGPTDVSSATLNAPPPRECMSLSFTVSRNSQNSIIYNKNTEYVIHKVTGDNLSIGCLPSITKPSNN